MALRGPKVEVAQATMTQGREFPKAHLVLFRVIVMTWRADGVGVSGKKMNPRDTDRDNKYSPTFYLLLIWNYLFIPYWSPLYPLLHMTLCQRDGQWMGSTPWAHLGWIDKQSHYELTPSNLDVIVSQYSILGRFCSLSSSSFHPSIHPFSLFTTTSGR